MRVQRSTRRRLPSARARFRSREQRRSSRVVNRVAMAAGFLCQCRSDIALAYTGWTEHEMCSWVFTQAELLGQCTDHTFIESSLGSVVDIFHTSGALQTRGANAPRESMVLSPDPLLIASQVPSDRESSALARPRLALSLVGLEQSLQIGGSGSSSIIGLLPEWYDLLLTRYSSPQRCRAAGGGGSEGAALKACWSREFFRIDYTSLVAARSGEQGVIGSHFDLAAEYCLSVGDAQTQSITLLRMRLLGQDPLE